MLARMRSVILILFAGLVAAPSAQAVVTTTSITAQLAGNAVTALGVAENGALWVADNSRPKVFAYGLDRQFVRTIGGGAGTSPGDLGRVSAIEPVSGGILVSSSELAGYAVQQFSETGELVRTFGGAGHESAVDVASTAAGVFALRSTGQVERYPADGAATPTATFSGTDGPQDAAIAATPAGTIVVLGKVSREVREFDASGTLLRTWAVPTSRPVLRIAVGLDGRRYVIGQGSPGAQVQQFSETGALLSTFVAPVGTTPFGLQVAGGRAYVLSGQSGELGVDAYVIGEPIVSLASDTFLNDGPKTLTASAFVPFGDLAGFDWDLDGDQAFEVTTAGPQVQTRFADGVRQVTVRARSTTGASAIAGATYTVTTPPELAGPTPPAGPVGVSINEGAKYTNDPNVELSLVWPLGTRQVTLANDGGFTGATTLAIARTVRWKLVETGAERLPKTVYVRFSSTGPNFTDDIVLDQTDPSIDRASVSPIGGGSRAALAAARYRLVTAAKDKTSGVASIQVATRRAKPGRWVPFKVRLSLQTAPRFVRVRDAAGNVSRWKPVIRR